MRSRTRLFVILLLVITLLAFSPVLFAGFTNWDDQVMVTSNSSITTLTPSSAWHLFTSFHERLYHPLVSLSYAIEYKFFGLNPFVFHLTNLTLHLLNVLLVFWFMTLLLKNRFVAFATALLFAIHPMHVESVAWISERKDVLYSFFFMGSLVSYAHYAETPTKKHYLLLSLVLFIASLLSKSLAIPLPLVLLSVDAFKQRKLDRAVWGEKLPFFMFSMIFGALASLGLYEHGVRGREFSFSPLGSLQAASENLMFYLIKAVAPFRLSCLYPRPQLLGNIPAWIFAWSPILILFLFAVVWRSAGRSKEVSFGLLFFLFTLLPVSQIVPVWLKVPADRYTYIPYIGLFCIVGHCFDTLRMSERPERVRRYALGGFGIIVVLLSALTFQRAMVWQDSVTLWADCLRNYKLSTAYYNMGKEYVLVRRDFDKGIEYFSKATEADPQDVESWINLGLSYYYKKEYQKALYSYDEAEKLDPKMFLLYLNRGNSLYQLGRDTEAILNYNRAIELNPSMAEGWYNRGTVYLSTQQIDKAMSDFSKAIELRRDYSDAYDGRGAAYASRGELDLAHEDFTKTIMLAPDSGDSYYSRALVSARQGRLQEAYADALKAESLGVYVDPNALEQLRREAEQRK